MFIWTFYSLNNHMQKYEADCFQKNFDRQIRMIE